MSVVSTSEEAMEHSQPSFIRWDLFLLIFLMPFDWLKVPAIGFRSIVWLAMIVPLVRLSLTPSASFRSFLKFLSLASYVHAAYALYLIILSVSLFWGPNMDTGLSDLLRALGQFLFYLVVGTTLCTIGYETTARTVWFAVTCAVVGFVFYCQYVFMAQGDSLVGQLSSAAASGQSNAIAQKVLKNVTNFQFESMSLDRQGEVLASVRNSISATLYIFLFAIAAFSNNRYRSAKELRIGRTFVPTLTLLMIFIPIAMFILMSRSNIIVLVCAPFVCCTLRLISNRISSRNSFFLPMLLLLLICVGAVFAIVSLGNNDFVALNVQRMQDITSDPRIKHYSDIYRLVTRSPWIGYGLGAETPDGLKVHNMFLGLWFRAGVVGLAVAIIFYLVISLSCLLKSTYSQKWAFWLPSLVLEPLLRAPLIGGQDGRFCRVEWLAIALFLYFCHVTWSEEKRHVGRSRPGRLSTNGEY